MITRKIVTALSGIALLLALPLFASAAVFHTGDQVNIASGETISDDVYAGGGTVTSSADITGDLYVGGGTLLIGGTIGTDLVAGGGNVTITSTIGDDLRVGGGTIVVQGSVQGDVIAGGGQINLAGSRISGDLVAGGGRVRVDSPVGGDVKIGGGEVYLNAPVVGNVEVDADKLTLGPNARIDGNLTYRSAHEATIEEGAVVSGATNFEQRERRSPTTAALAAVFSVAALVFILILTLGSLLLALFFKKYAHEVTENAFAGPLLELGRGLLVFVAMPIISVLLLVTVIGLPLGILGLLIYGALLIVSWFMAPVLLGSLLHHWIRKGGYVVSWKTVLLGVVAFFLMGLIPIIGGLIQFGFILLSLGSIARLKWHIAKSWR